MTNKREENLKKGEEFFTFLQSLHSEITREFHSWGFAAELKKETNIFSWTFDTSDLSVASYLNGYFIKVETDLLKWLDLNGFILDSNQCKSTGQRLEDWIYDE